MRIIDMKILFLNFQKFIVQYNQTIELILLCIKRDLANACDIIFR